MSPLAEELLLEFLHQKKLLFRMAGAKYTPVPNWPRAVQVWGKHMEEIARIVRDWDMPASVIIPAAFEQAKRNRHPDGPQMNMLKSEKYLTNALSYHLELPVAVVVERRSAALMLEIMDKEFSEVVFPPDLLAFTVEDACFRYVEARRRGEDYAAACLAPYVLQRISDDRRMDKWLEHRGYPFMDIAIHYNHITNNMLVNPVYESNR